MHIHRLKLEKFRGAQSLSLELHERLNVFVGMNGTGKSSILDAAAILLSWLVNRIKSNNASGRPITETDIKNDETSAKLEVTFDQDGKSFVWSIVKVRPGYGKMDSASALISVSEIAK